MKPEVLELVQASMVKSQGMLMEDIIDAHSYLLTSVFAACEIEEEGAGWALFKVFARMVNSDMKRNVEALVSWKRSSNAKDTPAK